MLVNAEAACIHPDVVDELFSALIVLQNHKDYLSSLETNQDPSVDAEMNEVKVDADVVYRQTSSQLLSNEKQRKL